MPSFMARIRDRFRDRSDPNDPTDDSMGLVIEDIETDTAAIGTNLHIPVYDDMSNADPSVSSIAMSLGQTPHGLWWHNGTQWVSGDRTKTAIAQKDLGGNDSEIISTFTMPVDMEIDIWQAHVSAIGGGSEAVYLDLYDVTADEVLFEHGYPEFGNTVEFGDPIDIIPIDDGAEIQFRARNDTGGSVTFGGWIVWSFQQELA